MTSINIYGAFPTTTIGPFHYLYRITNLVEQKHYYGIRTSKTIPPQNDLGVKYFSTSYDKDFIKDQKEHPKNYRYKIIRVSNSREKIAELEVKLHRKFKVSTHPKFYNISNQTSTGFDVSGKVTIKDYFGNTLQVPMNHPKLLSGEYTSINKGKVLVKDNNGNNLRVDVDDSRYLSGEYTSIHKGKIPVKDAFGNNLYVDVNDPRYLDGTLQHTLKGKNKGRVSVKDCNGNNLKVDVNDPRYLDGTLIHNAKGMLTVKDLDGNFLSVPKDHPKVLSGEYIFMAQNTKWISNLTLQKTKLIHKDAEIPSGWVAGRKISSATPKGSKWIHNKKLKKNTILKPGENLLEDWEYGMVKVWD